MRPIDADVLIPKCNGTLCEDCIANVTTCLGFIQTIMLAPTIEPPTTTWLNPYSPYTCQHCGKHTDSKTPFCAWCGRRASNYE